jgi:hypothetical protein
MSSSIKPVSWRLDDLGSRPLTWENAVSEGGLGPVPEWYITETVIYHQPKLTRQGPPGPAFRRRIARRRPGSMTSPST